MTSPSCIPTTKKSASHDRVEGRKGYGMMSLAGAAVATLYPSRHQWQRESDAWYARSGAIKYDVRQSVRQIRGSEDPRISYGRQIWLRLLLWSQVPPRCAVGSRSLCVGGTYVQSSCHAYIRVDRITEAERSRFGRDCFVGFYGQKNKHHHPVKMDEAFVC